MMKHLYHGLGDVGDSVGQRGGGMAFLLYPQEAASSDIASKFAIHRWKLETLLNEVLTTNKLELQRRRRNRRLDCRRFEAIAGGTNALAGLENAEDGLTLKRVTVLREVHRLSQRQF